MRERFGQEGCFSKPAVKCPGAPIELAVQNVYTVRKRVKKAKRAWFRPVKKQATGVVKSAREREAGKSLSRLDGKRLVWNTNDGPER